MPFMAPEPALTSSMRYLQVRDFAQVWHAYPSQEAMLLWEAE